jgi:hypothetical protein
MRQSEEGDCNRQHTFVGVGPAVTCRSGLPAGETSFEIGLTAAANGNNRFQPPIGRDKVFPFAVSTFAMTIVTPRQQAIAQQAKDNGF